MPLYMRKPDVTPIARAVQLNWANWDELCSEFDLVSPQNPGRVSTMAHDQCDERGPWIELDVPTDDGVRIARHGDYIVQELGKFSVVSSITFAHRFQEFASSING